jgi:hypothetical protein
LEALNDKDIAKPVAMVGRIMRGDVQTISARTERAFSNACGGEAIP